MSVHETNSMSGKMEEDENDQFITDFIGLLCLHESEIQHVDTAVSGSKMRIYNADGSYEEKNNHPDKSFGWMCSDFIIDENTPDFLLKNSCMRFCNSYESPQAVSDNNTDSAPRFIATSTPIAEETQDKLTLTCGRAKTMDNALEDSLTPSDILTRKRSSSDSDGSTDTEEVSVPRKYYEVKPNVEMAKIDSIQNTIVGPIGPDGKIMKDRLGIDWEKPPSGEELATLISPFSLKSRALLSILHNSKYQELMQDMKDPAKLTNLINYGDLKFLTCNEDGIEDIVASEILDYHGNKNDDSQLSLMTEIVLADIKCNIDDIVVKDKSTCDTTQVDFHDSVPFSCSRRNSPNSEEHFATSGQKTGTFDEDRSDLFRSIGLEGDFDRSLQSYHEECQELRAQIGHIKDAFQREEDKTQQLIQETRSLSREFEEASSLDDYVHLLQGDLDKVKNKMDGFRIFYNEAEAEGRNFIV